MKHRSQKRTCAGTLKRASNLTYQVLVDLTLHIGFPDCSCGPVALPTVSAKSSGHAEKGSEVSFSVSYSSRLSRCQANTDALENPRGILLLSWWHLSRLLEFCMSQSQTSNCLGTTEKGTGMWTGSPAFYYAVHYPPSNNGPTYPSLGFSYMNTLVDCLRHQIHLMSSDVIQPHPRTVAGYCFR